MEEIEQLTKFTEALGKIKSEEAQKGLTQILNRILCKPMVVQGLSDLPASFRGVE